MYANHIIYQIHCLTLSGWDEMRAQTPKRQQICVIEWRAQHILPFNLVRYTIFIFCELIVSGRGRSGLSPRPTLTHIHEVLVKQREKNRVTYVRMTRYEYDAALLQSPAYVVLFLWLLTGVYQVFTCSVQSKLQYLTSCSVFVRLLAVFIPLLCCILSDFVFLHCDLFR